MRIPFLDYITPRIFPKIRHDHRLKASRTITSGAQMLWGTNKW